jgi:hypothetical protein
MPSKDNKKAAQAGDSFRDYQDDRNASSKDALYCTSNGVPMPHPYETHRAGENGPLLLQDFHLIDLLSHFDRERIPERVVHAKGSGAHGVFKCTKPLDDLSCGHLQQGRQGVPDHSTILHCRRRVRFPRLCPRPSRVLSQVPHRRGKLGTPPSSSFETQPSSLTSSTPRSETLSPT